jgi:Zn-dependent protease with chaperone function
LGHLSDRVQTQGVTTETGWTAWSPAERESFFAAIARHRRAAWRVTVVTRAVNLVVALVVAVLMSPLFYAAVALALDVLNLLVPMPNLVPVVAHGLDEVFNAPGKMSVGDWIQFSVLAALPGLAWMAWVVNALRRVLNLSMSFDSNEWLARAPDPTVLAEQRFGNAVGEMAIAAALPPPRVFIVDSPVVDAVAFGSDDRHSTIVISQGLLGLLNRAQMEGVAASLVGAIADGDMKIGMQAALSLGLFSLIARLGSLVTQKNARRNVSQIVLATLVPTTRSARRLLAELADPFADEPTAAPSTNTRGATGGSSADSTAAGPTATVSARLSTARASAGAASANAGASSPAAAGTTAPGAGNPGTSAVSSRGGPIEALRERWEKIRPYLWLPLAGPLVMTGFLGAIVNLFMLGPLLSLAWRQRKYMADATAVRLTRDPDTLAGALEQMTKQRSAPLAPWAAHMSVTDHKGRQSGVFGGSAVPMFPSIDRRLRALGTMGAHITLAASPKIPLKIWLIATPLVAILVACVGIMLPLLVWLSLALTGLFGGIPFGIVHMILRALGHH